MFDNKELSNKGIKLAFLCNLWAWSKLFIVPGSSSVVNFFGLDKGSLRGVIFC